MNRLARNKPTSKLAMNKQTKTRWSRKGAVLQLAVGLIAAGAIAWMGIASVSGSKTSTVPNAKRIKFRGPTNPFEVEVALGELGLTPQVLTAAGLTATQTTTVASAWAASAGSNIADYRAAMDAVFQASTEVNRLERLVQAGGATSEDLTAFAAAQTALTTARAQKQSVLDTIYAAGTGSLGGSALALLNTARINHRTWGMPESYLVDSHTEHDWLNLRDAIANDRIAQQLGQDPDAASHTLLLSAQGTPNVSAALTNLANLPDIQAAWTAAMGN